MQTIPSQSDGESLTKDEFWSTLRRANRHLTAVDLSELKSVGLTVTQYSTLICLDRPVSQSTAQLARRVGISAQAMHSLVARLDNAGYVDRRFDQHSEVVIANSLSDDGRKALLESHRRLVSMEAQRRELLGEDDYYWLLGALRPLLRFDTDAHSSDQPDQEQLLQEVATTRIGAALRHINDHFLSELKHALRSVHPKLSVTQYLILETLAAGPMVPRQITERASIPQQSISSAVTGLFRAGLITAATSPVHPAIRIHSLTGPGQTTRQQLAALTQPVRDWPGTVISAAHLERATRVLARLASVTGDRDED